MEEQKIYCCIDLKSFYASVECVERGLDPFDTNLVVADPSRGRGGICLAITPYMKSQGVKNRCRIFEIPSSLEYITALPRMKLYMEYSAEIYGIYLKYISKEDIHVYSVDECFFDLTPYIELYGKTPREITMMLTKAVLDETGISAAAGIGTNMFLAKVALDVTAKHSPDLIGYLDQDKFKKEIWHHRPITDIWNIGKGIAKRLEKYGLYDLYDVAHFNEKTLYKEFGVNAEFLIDHSKGIEPCTIKEIQQFKAKTASLSNSQILFQDYYFNDAMLVMKEMVDLEALSLVDKNLLAGTISLKIGYSDSNIKPAGGMMKLPEYTNSSDKLISYFTKYFEKCVNPILPIRKITIGLEGLIQEEYVQLDLFSEYETNEKERKAQKAILEIKKKYGKNAILKGMNLQNKATARVRNKLIGGHNGE
ncbi:MAG: DNA repair protein [Clostridia bacterium]|nr:DNA repair protein [Clostridia bacterium]